MEPVRSLARLALALALLAGVRPAEARQTFAGQTPGGAFYTISAPDGWTSADDLVIYNHGFDLGSVEVEPDLGVLEDYLLTRGVAVAASSYRLNGWALFATLGDNRELFEAFVAALGEPARVFVMGGSLGALVTVQALEQGGVGNVAGGYALCGPLGGSDVWQQALDLRLAYDVVCEGTAGELPGGPEGLPFVLDPDDYDGILGDVTAGVLAAAVAACTGLGLPELLQTDGQQARRARLLELLGIAEPFLPINLGYATIGLSDLVQDPRKLDGRRALGNAGVVYGEPELDREIARVAADPLDTLYLRRFYTPSGELGAAKLVVTHTDKDDLVFPEHQQAYLAKADPGQVVAATVIDDAPAHCAYTEAEVVAGLETLFAWADGAAPPDARALQDHCEGLAALGAFAGPCRYDPGYEPAPLATRIRPRNVPEATVDGAMSGSYFIGGAEGQGWFVEVLPRRRAVAYWFTFDATGAPAWIGGTGRVIANGIVIEESWRGRGARFGAGFDPDDVELEAWGELAFVFPEPGAGHMEYAGPAAFGAGRTPFQQLTRVGAASCGAPLAGLSGLWFDPTRVGEGLIFEVQADGRSFAAWFTYDLEGAQLWLYGEATQVTPEGADFALARYAGPVFGPGYDPAALEATPWGTVSVRPGPDGYSLTYAADDPAFGAGELALTRLTAPLGAADCTVVGD